MINECHFYTRSRDLYAQFRASAAPLSPAEWQTHTDTALHWLRQAWAATGAKGFAHSYMPFRGWAKAYPETTGYLIETLRDYAILKHDPSLNQLADASVAWLESIQLPNGAFNGLLVGHTQPSVFNTAMILTGIQGESAWRALHFLVQALEPDGTWRKHAYVPGFVPTYYTYAVWRVLKANQKLKMTGIDEKMHHALLFYAQRFLPNGSIRDWGFHPRQAAYTHTIGYTLEGFWASALLLKDQIIMDRTLNTLHILWQQVKTDGRTAGRYDEHWNGDFSFRCNTGNAQLSALYQRVFQHTQNIDFQEAARFFLWEIHPPHPHLGKGGIPGSTPLWGPYLRFRYPNWSVKFYLDALNKC
jgi:hypothetical protein